MEQSSPYKIYRKGDTNVGEPAGLLQEVRRCYQGKDTNSNIHKLTNQALNLLSNYCT